MIDKRPLAQALRMHREALGFSQKELTRRSGVGNISSLERAARRPEDATLEALLEALGLTAAQLDRTIFRLAMVYETIDAVHGREEATVSEPLLPDDPIPWMGSIGGGAVADRASGIPPELLARLEPLVDRMGLSVQETLLLALETLWVAMAPVRSEPDDDGRSG